MADALDDPPIWAQMADFLCGPLTGQALLAELRSQFPHARRDDVYLAIAMAWTYHQAETLEYAIEVEGWRRKAGPRI